MESIWRQAKIDLTISTESGQPDTQLLEHGERVAASADCIAELVGDPAGAVDRVALATAALYCASGWAVQYAEKAIARHEILAKPMSELQRELSAAKAEEALAALLSRKRLEAVCRTIRDSGQRRTTYLPAQILAEACNLDDIGPLSLWRSIRKHVADGQDITGAIRTWSRQREYNFWHARIKDAFRFEVVKGLAYERLEALDRFMAVLQQHAEGADLQRALEERRTHC